MELIIMKKYVIIFIALLLVLIFKHTMTNIYHKDTFTTSKNNWMPIINIFVSGNIEDIEKAAQPDEYQFVLERINKLNGVQVLKEKRHLFSLYKWSPLQKNNIVWEKNHLYNEYILGYYRNNLYYKMIILPRKKKVYIQHYLSNNLHAIDYKNKLGVGPWFKVPQNIK